MQCCSSSALLGNGLSMDNAHHVKQIAGHYGPFHLVFIFWSFFPKTWSSHQFPGKFYRLFVHNQFLGFSHNIVQGPIFRVFLPITCPATNLSRICTKIFSGEQFFLDFFPKYCPVTNCFGTFTKYLSRDQFFWEFLQKHCPMAIIILSE